MLFKHIDELVIVNDKCTVKRVERRKPVYEDAGVIIYIMHLEWFGEYPHFDKCRQGFNARLLVHGLECGVFRCRKIDGASESRGVYLGMTPGFLKILFHKNGD